MKQVALILVLLVINLLGCDAGFESCRKKTKDLHVIQKSDLYIPLDNQKTLVFSSKNLSSYIKKDAFLNLYLIKSKKKYHYPFKINKYLKFKDIALITNKKMVCSKILHQQTSLNDFGQITQKINSSGVVLNGCCELVAINTKKGLISKKFINNFLYKDKKYTELGIRVSNCKNRIYVNSVNPFIKSPFKIGDEILKINKFNIKTKEEFDSISLFLKPSKKANITIKRCDKTLTLHVKPLLRKGGGFLSDTYLEYIGIFLDEDMKVIKSTQKIIQKGDIIKKVNSKNIKSFKDIQTALNHNKNNKINILISRNNFEFFINLDVN